MEFGLSEQQTALQDSVNRFLDEKAPLERVRQYSEERQERADDIWDGLVELGLPALLVPESQGGIELGALDAAVVCECLGRHVTPSPFLSTAVLAPTAIKLAGSEEQQNRYLPEIANGSATFGAALSEATGARRDAGVSATRGKLDGKALFVIDLYSDNYLVADTDNQLHIVPSDASGLTINTLPQIDRTRPIGEITFNSTPSDALADDGQGSALRAVIDIGRVMIAADTLGASQEMLDQSVQYAMGREQFNRVIASFQAVKHMCAEMAAEIEPSRALLWYAAHTIDEDPEESHLNACHTKAHLSEVGSFIGKTATIVHGGMGFTDLLGLHYWFKRIGYNRQILGGPESVREEAASAQGLC
ncbi:MAG: acyl-CoA dehydrogenase family protein [Pseudomonadota bacterium]|nr:acyl-CoA dehydrogenase family protein [Pseudomonadota bacterium]